MNHYRFLRVLFLIILILNVISSFGIDDPINIQVLKGKDGAIVKNAVLELSDPIFSDSVARLKIIQTYNIIDVISLKLDEESRVFIKDSFELSLDLEITVTNELFSDSIFQKQIRLKYRPGKGLTSEFESYFVFNRAWKVKVKIKEIYQSGEWDATKVLILQSSIQASRRYLFTCGSPSLNIEDEALGQIFDDAHDELLVKWSDPNLNQTDYDLEWAWVDFSASANFKDASQQWLVNRIFQNNSSRVTLPASMFTSYKIPLLYDGSGYLFYRLRLVQRNIGGQRFEGEWSAIVGANLTPGHGICRFDGHENGINWQASTAYAEDGKRKSVIQYFDGTLRSRQTVTKDNSVKNLTGDIEPTTVVAESFTITKGDPPYKFCLHPH